MDNGQRGQEGGITKGNEETSGSGRYVHYPDFHDGSMGADICQILSNCTFKCVGHCVSIVPQKTPLKNKYTEMI